MCTDSHMVVHRYNVPLLMHSAGSDRTVWSNYHVDFCSTSVSDCKLETIDGSFHNILYEKDQYRNTALTKAFAFFDKHATEPARHP